jgi:hypothetical protein
MQIQDGGTWAIFHAGNDLQSENANRDARDLAP